MKKQKYCCYGQRSGCYFEFQAGDFSAHNSFWLSDSLFLSDDIVNAFDMGMIFSQAIPEFDYYGATKVSQAQWENFKAIQKDLSPEQQAIINEIDDWAQCCFQSEECFSILGI